MDRTLKCGKYTVAGEDSTSIYFDILDEDYKLVETIEMPMTGSAFKDGDFTSHFKQRIAIAVARKYDSNARDIIECVNKANARMMHIAHSAKTDPFAYIANAKEIADLLLVISDQLTESDRRTYELYRSVKANLDAFTEDPENMDEEVALSMGHLDAYHQIRVRRLLEAKRAAEAAMERAKVLEAKKVEREAKRKAEKEAKKSNVKVA